MNACTDHFLLIFHIKSQNQEGFCCLKAFNVKHQQEVFMTASGSTWRINRKWKHVNKR